MLLAETPEGTIQRFELSVSYSVRRDMVSAARLLMSVPVAQDPVLRECPAVSLGLGRGIGGRRTDREIVPVSGPDRRLFYALLEKESEPGFGDVYNARVLGLPGCNTYGRGIEEAISNLREALALYLDE